MARSRRTPGGKLILDSGAVIGWSRGDQRVRALLRDAVARNMELRVPVVVLAETLRGGPRDAPVNRVLKAVGVAPTEAAAGRVAGGLLGASGGRNTAGALVAAEALAAPESTLLTGDPDDLRALLSDHPEVRVLRA